MFRALGVLYLLGYVIFKFITYFLYFKLKEESTKNQLKALFRVIFGAANISFSSHFNLFTTHVCTALTDIRLSSKLFAFDILLMLLRYFPDLCAQKIEIFDRYLEIMLSDRRPTKHATIIESISLISSIYEKPTEKSLWESQTVSFFILNKKRS